MGLADLMGTSTRANMGKQMQDMELVSKEAARRKKGEEDPKSNVNAENGKNTMGRPPNMSKKAYQDLNGKWHEPGSLD